ncbi:MAG: DUF4013 domain-containing protein [Anaerolineaceae bacterium]|mgnify:CR=1 FL=1|jgi:hypothetical protein|nr:DUF4013 domain-containing protein [Anaerolineaceae bacterium]MDD4043678.1 DUF4013 domain-containing protein [Anaerolineaceae bacterium]MDD4578051.1 DUF4013 domain-containing protein [Anaerolineaceae bacterium]
MNFGKAFTFIFEDEQWFDKLLAPVLISIIPIIGTLAFIGYTLRLIKNVVQNEPNPLPRMEFGEDLGRGFRFFLIGLVYMIPVFLVLVVMLIPMSALNNNEAVGLFGVIVMIIGGLLLLAYSLFLAIFEPIAMANFAVKDTFASGFEWGNFFKRLGNNFPAWLIVLAGVIIAGFISPLGSILLVIGVVLTSAYSQLMVAHLTGQAYAASETKQ